MMRTDQQPEAERRFFEDLDEVELISLRDAIYAELVRRGHERSHGAEDAA
jgi:hypothetical protein